MVLRFELLFHFCPVPASRTHHIHCTDISDILTVANLVQGELMVLLRCVCFACAVVFRNLPCGHMAQVVPGLVYETIPKDLSWDRA